MSDGADKDYSGKQKKDWRGWQWNRIVEKLHLLGKKPQNSIVVYLAGITDFDRPVAMARGFRPENLIAIDRESKVVDKLRSENVLAVSSTLLDACIAWPSNRPVDVLLADFCSGFNQEASDFAGAIYMNPAFSNVVLASNFQRGRDAQTNELRASISERFNGCPVDSKHRGLIFFHAMWDFFWERQRSTERGAENLKLHRDAYIEYSKLGAAPQINSYKSKSETNGKKTTVVFDSCVFVPPSLFASAQFITNGLFKSKEAQKIYGCGLDELVNKKTKSSITATLAVRTRRINAFASN